MAVALAVMGIDERGNVAWTVAANVLRFITPLLMALTIACVLEGMFLRFRRILREELNRKKTEGEVDGEVASRALGSCKPSGTP